MYEIIFYEDEEGNKPVEHYIDQLDAMADSNKNARILLESIVYCLHRLEDAGTRSGSKFTKHIKGKIWEVRPRDHRILFFGWYRNRLVLLHHFRKETNKTPIREIEIAEKRMIDWIERFGSDKE